MTVQDSLQTTFDHLIFGSYFLEDGVNFILDQLGIRPQKGGQHLTMGTHNAVLKLADTTYLEVIAIDPNLPKPPRPRWFGMDNLQPGIAPTIIQWAGEAHPAQRLSASDVTLTAIEAVHPNAAELNTWLTEIGYDGPFIASTISTGETCRLRVTLESTKGPVIFESLV
ncbi:VOC family protein [Spirosoma linguale]|uniref:Glyoxalase-like domain-containing protein n=1 Tax=Spirosoma linguale (strain ATCC 33905 / DSM 74 / LMG 10896 / Claus 1) TaxID=504472 RepID=D2QII2_SPILD|nr:conserved hypothetical protein [Spirosoma linguale DSM 74]